MGKMKIKEIVFDWSGTISDDFYAVLATTNDILSFGGKERLSEAQFRDVFDLPVIDFYRKFFSEPDMDENSRLFKRFWPENLRRYPLKPIDGVGAHLDKLKSLGVCGSIISAHYDVVNEVERYFPEKGYFREIFMSSHDKAAALLEFSQKQGVAPEHIAYVGDMMGDIRAARMAGVHSVCVLTGYHTREQLLLEKPDRIINNIGELPDVVLFEPVRR